MITLIVVAIVFGVIMLVIVDKLSHKIPKKHLNHKYFQKKWTNLLNLVKSPEGMILAVIDADKLLDEALKRRHFKGATMGERLVSAQHVLSNNDSVWHAHKLRNKLVHETNMRLKKKETQNALEGIKQGLKDLGAL